jgi:serine/threonine protein kinase
MSNQKDRRRWPRKVLETPDIGFLDKANLGQEPDNSLDESTCPCYVDICEISQGGVLIKSEKKIESNNLFQLKIYNATEKLWQFYQGSTKWVKSDPSKPGYFNIGLEVKPLDQTKMEDLEEKVAKLMPLPEDFEFFRQMKLLNLIPRDAVCPLLNSLTYKYLKAGERLMTQGELGDRFYIIQSGLCVANVKKNGEIHPIARLRAGDIVGEMAIVTGESRNANIDAETDMELWCLTKSQFDEISIEYPELRSFLTELVTNRFETSKVTAERRINKYIITDIMGHGGYSVVYKGIHSDLNMPVAIKMMKHDLAMNTDFLRSFRNEAKIIARFNHDNIVRVYDIEELYRTVFIIMELLDGENLNDMLRRLGFIPLPWVVDFLFQICNGLSYAHKKKIVHQDIKPANLFIQRDGRVKILDYGLACPFGSEDQPFQCTAFYISPEQIEWKSVDQRTDIYSLGITAYEMVTGERPYPEDDLMILMDMHLNQDIPDPSNIVPDLPKELREFILKACRRNPDERYQSAGEAITALEPIIIQYDLVQNRLSLEKKKMTTFFLVYSEDSEIVLGQIIKNFTNQVQPFGIIKKAEGFQLEKRKMTTLFLIYSDDHQLSLNQIMEEFSTKVKELGVVQMASDFQVK